MKASELIKKLQEMIETYGDKEVEHLESYSYKPVNYIVYNENGDDEMICQRHADTFII